MKKSITFLTALLLLVAGVFAASSSRKTIEKFFEDYEEFVEAYEEIAEENDLMAMLELSELLVEMSENAEEIQDFDGWTLKDTKRLLILQERLAKAVDKLSGTSSTPSLGGMSLDSFDLGSYGF